MYFFFCFLLFFSTFLNLFFFFSISGFFNFSFTEKTLVLPLGFDQSIVPVLFLMMVFLVTSLVLLYSEFYMEFYQNKKFLILTLLFFFFMALLSSSSSIMNLMIGWDGLGISSLILIMFYPNKITLFNSFLTFFFNRVGDILFIIFFSYFICNTSAFFHLNSEKSLFFSFFFLLCLFTKSAQIPFSSWLPAAMSAPTPISAMVHSSTLVTAGLYIVLKMNNFFLLLGLNLFMVFISCLTFLLGGVLATLETDLKKVVAFSTMSQISLIMFFISLGFWSISFMHIFTHALFKTLLFIGCGVAFIYKNGNQLLPSFSGSSISMTFSAVLLFSIYSMSGTPYSGSFFTKDLVLENLLESGSLMVFLVLIFGSFLTLIYSGSILNILVWNSLKNFMTMKIFCSPYLILFSFLTLCFNKIFGSIMFLLNDCMISLTEVLMINLLIFLSMFFKFNLSNYMFMSSEILFMKSVTFSFFYKFYLHPLLSKSLVDTLFFKASVMEFSKYSMSIYHMKNKFWFYPFSLFLLSCII